MACTWFHRAVWTLTIPVLSYAGAYAWAGPPATRGLDAVDHERVQLSGGFWGPRLKTHHEVTVPHALDCLERGGHITNFDKAAGKFDGPLRGHHAFDSDLHKALEGAIYSLQHFDDPKLLRRVDEICDRILAAQQDDGYLTVDHGEADVFKISLPRDAKLSAEHRTDLLGGVTVLRTTARDDQRRDVELTAVPYYAWQNCEPGAMTVWVDEQ